MRHDSPRLPGLDRFPSPWTETLTPTTSLSCHMTGFEVRLQTWFGAAVEVVYSFFAFVLVAFPFLALGDDAFGEPLGLAVAPLALFVGVVGMTAFRLQDRSFEHLGHFVVAAFGAGVVWVIVLTSTLYVTDLSIGPRDPLSLFVAWTLALATAGVLVYRGEDALA